MNTYCTPKLVSAAKCEDKFVEIDRLFPLGKEVPDIKDRILLAGAEKADEQCAYKLFFLRVSALTRQEVVQKAKKSISFSDSSSWKLLSDAYMNLQEELNNRVRKAQPSARLMLNLSFGDFCLLVPNNSGVDDNALLSAISEWAEFVPEKAEDVWKSDENLEAAKKEVEKRLGTTNVYRMLPHYGYQNELFDKLLKANVDTVDKAWECARQAAVLLHTFLDEAGLFYFQGNGDAKKISAEYRQDTEVTYKELRESYDLFFQQIPTTAVFSDTVWSYLFFCDALLSSFVGRSAESGEVGAEEYNDFYGFIPIISDDTETMDSKFPDQYGILYSMGFLCIPYSLTFNFFEKVPSLLHEFSHYIFTPNRSARNEAALKLSVFSVVNKVIQDISIKIGGNEGRLWAKRVFDSIVERYNEFSEWINPRSQYPEHTKLNNSMFFLHTTADVFDVTDFSDLYDRAYSLDNLPKRVEMILNDRRQECIEIWEKYAVSFLLTFTMALREIRSDIAMSIALGIGLRDYILLMALEPTWADFPASRTADSVFLRFGFMTRYLFYKANSDSMKFRTVSEFNEAWRDEVEKQLVALKTEKIQGKLEHMREYLDEYIKLSFSCGNEGFLDDGYSLFEKMVYSPLQFTKTFDEDCGDIISAWEEQFDGMFHRTSLVAALKEHYARYCESSCIDRIGMNYQARLILRDLFMLIPNVDQE